MITTPRALLLTLPFVIGAASADTEFVAIWPDGQEIRACSKGAIPGMSDPCETARLGYWQPVGMPPIAEAVTLCVPNGCHFTAKSDCISNFNC